MLLSSVTEHPTAPGGACECTVGFGYKYSRTKVVGLRAAHISLRVVLHTYLLDVSLCFSQSLGLAVGVHVWASLR